MKYAKYYNVSKIVENMQKAGEIDCYPTGDNKFEGIYVCMDTNDFGLVESIKDIMKNMNGKKENI